MPWRCAPKLLSSLRCGEKSSIVESQMSSSGAHTLRTGVLSPGDWNFESCKRVKHGAGSATVTMLTLDGGTVGTPAYMAPEIALGHGNEDGRADIYSLGCVAYYLLTGQTVFSAETLVALALAHVQDEPVPPSKRSRFDIPASLDALVLECLAKDPAARPESAVALEHRLAATVPHDAWTSAAAHAWWECHGAAVTGIGRSSAETAAADTQGDIDREYPRFWPRLERRPLITP
jgi:serine/threonine protein kinase